MKTRKGFCELCQKNAPTKTVQGQEVCALHISEEAWDPKVPLTKDELDRLGSWLRCYPVEGREDERRNLQAIVEREFNAIHGFAPHSADHKIEDSAVSATAKVSHTPGPWFVNESIAEELYVENSQGMICDMQLSQAFTKESVPTIQADARLIASAPELLAWLIRARAFVPANQPALRDSINAAIAKAQGKI